MLPSFFCGYSEVIFRQEKPNNSQKVVVIEMPFNKKRRVIKNFPGKEENELEIKFPDFDRKERRNYTNAERRVQKRDDYLNNVLKYVENEENDEELDDFESLDVRTIP